MFADLYNVILFVIQVLALLWGVAFSLRFIFGFGLDKEGRVVCSNKRGKFLSNLVGHMALFARRLRGKTHDTDVKAADAEGRVIMSVPGEKAQPRDEQAAQ